MVTLNDTVWIIMQHNKQDHRGVDSIIMVCFSAEIAQEKLAWLQEDNSSYDQYWIEDHEVVYG